MSIKLKPIPLVICIAIPLGIGAIGGLATASEIGTWYTTLNKPPYNPPGWLFGPVWTILYLFMGVASYLVWQARHQARAFLPATAVYLAQLVFNLAWTFLFFYFHSPGLALIDILILLLLIIINALLFYRIHKAAGWLFVPYILWVSFASFLNYSIFKLN